MDQADRLAIAAGIEPAVAAARHWMDRECRLTPEAVTALRESGIARAAVPAALGGPELDPMAQIELVEAFSRVDGAVGWCAMIASASSYACGFLGPASAERWFGPPDAWLAGQLQPTGRAERVDGGYVVSGRFRFGSGIAHATMVLAGCLVTEGGEQAHDERGRPRMRTVIVTPAQVEVVGNWDTGGLRATGSSDYVVDDVFVPEEDSYDPAGGAARSGPLYGFSPLFLAPHDGVPLGMARRAIDEVVALAEAKGVPAFGPREPPRLRDTVQVQEAVARAEVGLGGARALCYETVGDLWATLVAGRRPDARQRGLHRAAMTWAHEVGRDVVIAMFDVAATSAIQRNGVLERLHRDTATACQHRVVHTRVYAEAGRLLLGLRSGDPTL
ncbi:MAG: acyl-CoA dehydrogenase family protein [Acidimicrobiales bacterium]